jgi:Zn-dependent protease
MRWSIKLGKLFGIELRVHLTFLLLLAFVGLAGLQQGGSRVGITAVLFISAVFFCVILHELAHSLASGAFGFKAESITLLPIGGVASLRTIPEEPYKELLISFVGPATSLGIFWLLYVLLRPVSVAIGFDISPGSPRQFFTNLMSVNLMLAVFNLIPAFPMDGGRILRGILAMGIGYDKATRIAAALGKGFAALLIFAGLLANVVLEQSPLLPIIIGLFIYLGASAEGEQAEMRALLRRVPVGEIMSREFVTLHPEDELGVGLRHIMLSDQHDFPVVEEGRPVGLLSRKQLLSAVHDRGIQTKVYEAMIDRPSSISPDAPVSEAYQRMLASGHTALLVMDDTQLVGILALENISHYFMRLSAAAKHRAFR